MPLSSNLDHQFAVRIGAGGFGVGEAVGAAVGGTGVGANVGGSVGKGVVGSGVGAGVGSGLYFQADTVARDSLSVSNVCWHFQTCGPAAIFIAVANID